MSERLQNKNLRRTAGPGRPKGSINKAKRDIQLLARELIESGPYKKSLKERLITGKAPHMEPILFYYAYGKPIERVEIIDKLESTVAQMATKYGLSVEQVIARLRLVMGGRVA